MQVCHATCAALLASIVVSTVLGVESCETSRLLTKPHSCLPDIERTNGSMIDLRSLQATAELRRIRMQPVPTEQVPTAIRVLEAACMALRSETDNSSVVYDGYAVSVDGATAATAERAMYLNRVLELAGTSGDPDWETSFFFQHARNHLTTRKAYRPSRPSPLDITSGFAFASVVVSLARTADQLSAGLLIRAHALYINGDFEEARRDIREILETTSIVALQVMAIELGIETFWKGTLRAEDYREHVDMCERFWLLIRRPATLPTAFARWLSLGDGDEDCEGRHEPSLSLQFDVAHLSRHVMSEHVTKLQWLGQHQEARALSEQAVRDGLFPSVWQRPARQYDPTLRALPIWRLEDDPHVAQVCALLEREVGVIRGELLALMQRRPSAFVPEEDLHDRATGQWSEFYLFSRGNALLENHRLVPKTSSILARLAHARDAKGAAYFSRLTPGTHVRTHTGAHNTRLRAHLALIAERGGARLRVGNLTRGWEEDRCFVFDDSFEHEVTHAGHQERIVLVLDIKHPDQ